MAVAKEFTVGRWRRGPGLRCRPCISRRKGPIRSHRTSGNQRRFDKDVIRRVAVIKLANELGIPLARVAAAFGAMPHDRPLNKDDWAGLSQRWRDDLERRITLLSRLRDELSGCIGCGCLSMENCPLINPEDRLGAEGTGPRRLLRPGREVLSSAQEPDSLSAHS